MWESTSCIQWFPHKSCLQWTLQVLWVDTWHPSKFLSWGTTLRWWLNASGCIIICYTKISCFPGMFSEYLVIMLRHVAKYLVINIMLDCVWTRCTNCTKSKLQYFSRSLRLVHFRASLIDGRLYPDLPVRPKCALLCLCHLLPYLAKRASALSA